MPFELTLSETTNLSPLIKLSEFHPIIRLLHVADTFKVYIGDHHLVPGQPKLNRTLILNDVQRLFDELLPYAIDDAPINLVNTVPDEAVSLEQSALMIEHLTDKAEALYEAYSDYSSTRSYLYALFTQRIAEDNQYRLAKRLYQLMESPPTGALEDALWEALNFTTCAQIAKPNELSQHGRYQVFSITINSTLGSVFISKLTESGITEATLLQSPDDDLLYVAIKQTVANDVDYKHAVLALKIALFHMGTYDAIIQWERSCTEPCSDRIVQIPEEEQPIPPDSTGGRFADAAFARIVFVLKPGSSQPSMNPVDTLIAQQLIIDNCALLFKKVSSNTLALDLRYDRSISKTDLFIQLFEAIFILGLLSTHDITLTKSSRPARLSEVYRLFGPERNSYSAQQGCYVPVIVPVEDHPDHFNVHHTFLYMLIQVPKLRLVCVNTDADMLFIQVAQNNKKLTTQPQLFEERYQYEVDSDPTPLQEQGRLHRRVFNYIVQLISQKVLTQQNLCGEGLVQINLNNDVLSFKQIRRAPQLAQTQSRISP